MVFPYQVLKEIIYGKRPMILADEEIKESQIQPATLDLRLGDRVYCMSTTMVPRPGETVAELIKKYSSYDFEMKKGSFLHRGGYYIIPLKEKLDLSPGVFAVFSPKSSIGRIDVFVRVVMDGVSSYDYAPCGYKGPIYLELVSQSFDVEVSQSVEMVQMRIKESSSVLSNSELERAHSKDCLAYSNSGEIIVNPRIENNSLYLNVELDREIVGFEARSGIIERLDLSLKWCYDSDEFWTPIKRPKNGELILSPDRFYLLSTKERVKIPDLYSAEMVAYDMATGEFRTHYAGFFDNGFGSDSGTHAVMEVRAISVSSRLYDGQPICRMVFEKTTEVPEKLYGAGLGSNYISPQPCLAKYFKKKCWS